MKSDAINLPECNYYIKRPMLIFVTLFAYNTNSYFNNAANHFCKVLHDSTKKKRSGRSTQGNNTILGNLDRQANYLLSR